MNPSQLPDSELHSLKGETPPVAQELGVHLDEETGEPALATPVEIHNLHSSSLGAPQNERFELSHRTLNGGVQRVLTISPEGLVTLCEGTSADEAFHSFYRVLTHTLGSLWSRNDIALRGAREALKAFREDTLTPEFASFVEGQVVRALAQAEERSTKEPP